MHILIVENEAELGQLWQRHLERAGKTVTLVTDEEKALEKLHDDAFSILILDIVLPGGSAFAVADYAAFRHPQMNILFVTRRSFFSDGSLFRHVANACAVIPAHTAPADLEAMVEHYALS